MKYQPVPEDVSTLTVYDGNTTYIVSQVPINVCRYIGPTHTVTVITKHDVKAAYGVNCMDSRSDIELRLNRALRFPNEEVMESIINYVCKCTARGCINGYTAFGGTGDGYCYMLQPLCTSCKGTGVKL